MQAEHLFPAGCYFCTHFYHQGDDTMAKRKKYPKLPNGYGSIKYLGKGRRNPYAVHPPTTEFTLDGIPKTPKALCYVDDYMKGFAVLTAYKAGTYVPGMERDLVDIDSNTGNLDSLAQTILADYGHIKHTELVEEKKPTFAEVYEQFYDYKYARDKSRQYSDASRGSTRAAFKNCAAIHDTIFEELRHKDLQAVIDNCPRKHASLELILSLFHQMYRYAVAYEIVDKDCSTALRINSPEDEEHGIPFSDDELKILWQHTDNQTVEMILIMCYCGYRIGEYKKLKVNLQEKYFQGGIKTAAGKGRVVPIHGGIYPLVYRRMKRDGNMLKQKVSDFRHNMYAVLQEIGIKRHTPHDCRHTFSRLCEKYHVRENDRKRMLGHSFGSDITNRVYGHREIDDLRQEIEKIKICY